MGKIEKRLVLLSIVLISLLCIGAVSAADDAASDIVSDAGDVSIASTADEMETIDSIDEEIDDVTLIDDVADESQSSIEEEIVDDSSNNALGEESTKTFTNLKDEIGDKSEVTLSGTYKYDATADAEAIGDWDIKLSQNVVISGPATIDGNQLHRAFVVYPTGNVTLKGLTFINCIDGAIYNYQGILNIENCTFKSNSKDDDWGGAVFNYDGKLNVENSTFESNSAGYGGAISHYDSELTGDSSLTIKNSNFIGNKATSAGGAIDIIGIGAKIDYCLFNSNTAMSDPDSSTTTGDAGAIMFEFLDYEHFGYHNVTNSIFINNKAGNSGSTIRNDAGYVVVNNCILLGPETVQGKPILCDLRDDDFKYNWWGHTVDNASVTLSEDMDFSMPDNWYVLNLTAVDAGSYYDIIASLNNLYDKATGEISVVDECGLPETLFDVNCDKGSLSQSTVNVQNGLGTVKYTLFGEGTGIITLSNGDVSVSKELEAFPIPSDSLTNLKSLIDAASDGDIIELHDGYNFYQGIDDELVEGIVIDKAITIKGHLFAIDGGNAARLFKITAAGVTLEDLTVQNGKADYGAGILVDEGASVTIKNVEFINNVATEGGDAFYSNGEVSLVDSTVSPSNVNVSVSVEEMNGESVVVVSLTDAEGNPIDGKVNVTVDGQTQEVNVTAGKGTLPTGPGEHNIVITSPDGSTKTTKVLVQEPETIIVEKIVNVTQPPITVVKEKIVKVNAAAKIGTVITISPKKALTFNKAIDKKADYYLIATLKDAKGNLLKGKKVSFAIDGKVYNVVTNAKGQAKIVVTYAKKGTYGQSVTFLGDDKYAGSFAALKLKVVAQKVKLTAPKKTFKATKKVKKLTATLKNLKGKAIKGKKITFIVNGKKYTAKTNKKGVATVKVKLTAKKTYKVKVKFAGDKTYKKATKKSSVKIK